MKLQHRGVYMKNNNKMYLSEIFTSIQGESLFAGKKCRFYRFSNCNLDCTYCDTPHKNVKKINMTQGQIIDDIINNNCRLIEFTGGEPLLNQDYIISIVNALRDYTFLIETNGSIRIDSDLLQQNVHVIMDYKSPSSLMNNKMCFENFDVLRNSDEIKFVLCQNDIEWFKMFYTRQRKRSKQLWYISPVFESVNLQDLAKIVIESNNDLTLQLQLHKLIWHKDKRGV